MKKSIKIALSILVLVLIGYFGYTHFKKTSVLLNVIHKDAESVIKVGVHDIKKTLLLDVLSSPSYYWKNSKLYKDSKKDDSKEDDDIGVDFKPYTMAFYSIKNIDNTLFTTFKINDSEAFEKYIKKYAQKKSSLITNNEIGYKNLVLEKSQLILAWNSEKIALALTLDASLEKLKVVFEDVLLKNQLISDKNHKIIKQLSTSNDHIVYLKNESIIRLNFKDKEAIIDGNIFTQKADAYKMSTTYNGLPEASFQFYFDGNFNSIEHKTAFTQRLENLSFFSKNNIEATQLINKTNGFLSIGIKGTTMQSDTIVGYEYNDNFEKVAVKKLQEKEVPKISINLGVNKNESLNMYLQNQGAIKNDVLLSIPYYTFYTNENGNNLSLSTAKEDMNTEEINSSSFFNLDVNFNRLQKDISIPRANEVFGLLETLNLRANQLKGTNQIKIEGCLIGKSEDVNIISQIFFGLEKQKAEEDLVNENI
ncbi:hypothetical protein HNV10_03335 [Winogradskyella litoriviva]|uniref:DUF945 domain-containing protein n=1 Tax=Winogradskyella litoriviva TaxID=1220182 RepID=A0ABX2E196_9FLAO|nr:hypothetical protein [Winogradskyella litoriviva]NRD22258.1 hypothetical protein [Winogradskyella litoriviva]